MIATLIAHCNHRIIRYAKTNLAHAHTKSKSAKNLSILINGLITKICPPVACSFHLFIARFLQSIINYNIIRRDAAANARGINHGGRVTKSHVNYMIRHFIH